MPKTSNDWLLDSHELSLHIFHCVASSKNPSKCWATLFRCKFWGDVSRFSLCKNWLPKVDSHSTFRRNFHQPATNDFFAQQVDHARRKMQKKKKKPKTCSETMSLDKLMVLVSRISPPEGTPTVQ